MKCKICGGKVRVRDTRVVGDTVIRWRECFKCCHEYYTIEKEIDFDTGRKMKNAAINAQKEREEDDLPTQRRLL